ncbi:hypothetical protein CDD81_2146 [Ophiocordyceps australis]|uniref:chitin deacetylase n=1 Tax=Ophiocordyceps australis TaxID=1399860 RepID=A0A2C5XY65_9HYPO|nr:hypothetical protein CDD81_2146 [Ophiocordyceps australis]
MPRLALFRLPAKLGRRLRRRRMATLSLATTLLLLTLLLPPLACWTIYSPPHALISLLRTHYPDVLFELPAISPRKLIALSLDDAPSAHTPSIMAALHASNAKATFFVIGAQAPSRFDTLRSLVRAGHELANHAMHDEASRALPDALLAQQLADVADVIAAVYRAEKRVLPNNYFRPGSGFFSQRMRALVGKLGFRIVLGSVYPHDAQIPFPALNARHILAKVRPGAIVICHDRRDWTAPMLRILLPELRRRGYEIVTITDLVRAAEPMPGSS